MDVKELRREKIDIKEQTKRNYRGVNTWYQIDGDAYKTPYKLFLLQYCEHLCLLYLLWNRTPVSSASSEISPFNFCRSSSILR